jgi:hypothetical protein
VEDRLPAGISPRQAFQCRKLPSMADARKNAQTIYEQICATSADRPFSFRSVEQMHREIATWQANNPALANLRQAPPEVQTAFLSQSMEWLKAESRDHSNFRVTSTLVDAILHTLNAAPKPLPSDVVLSASNKTVSPQAVHTSPGISFEL